MYKYLFLGLLLCGFTISTAQSLPTKQEQLEFLKWYINYNHLVPISDTSIFVPLSLTVTSIDDINRILTDTKQSKAGRSYIKRQAYLLKETFTLDTIMLQKLKWNKGKANGRLISTMSLPVFSTDRKLAIITYGFYCGITCGREGTEVFIKDKHNKWVAANIPTKVIMF